MEKGLFLNSGDFKIKCTAAIDQIYQKSNEETIQEFPERNYNYFWESGDY